MKNWKVTHPTGPNGFWEITDEEGNSIATLYGDTPETQANAYLIAAAPTMKDELQEMYNSEHFDN